MSEISQTSHKHLHHSFAVPSTRNFNTSHQTTGRGSGAGATEQTQGFQLGSDESSLQQKKHKLPSPDKQQLLRELFKKLQACTACFPKHSAENDPFLHKEQEPAEAATSRRFGHPGTGASSPHSQVWVSSTAPGLHCIPTPSEIIRTELREQHGFMVTGDKNT